MNYDLELEKAILGIMLIDQSVIPNITRELQENDFFDVFNREIFRTIISLNAKGSADIISLDKETCKKNTGYIATLTDTVASSANWRYYTTSIKQFSILRGLQRIVDEVKETNQENIEENLNEFIRRATELSDVSGGTCIKAARELIMPMISSIEAAYKAKGSLIGIDTGFTGLNDKLDGFQKEFIIIGARPSVGKTALVVNMMNRQAKKGIKVGLISCEMKANKIMLRLISDSSGINSRSIKNGMLSMSNFAQIQDKCSEVYNYPFYIDDTSMELSQVVSSCRSMVRILGVQIIYIDHAGLIIVKEKAQQWEKGNIKSKTLKALQKELDIPLVLLSQVGRQAEGKHPTLADLRDSGSFEEDGDTIMFLHRERIETNDDMPIPSELYVAKAKDGEIGTVNLLFYPKVTRFVDEIVKNKN